MTVDASMPAAVVLLSGGMDSVTLLHYVVRELKVPLVHALSFHYGQKHSRELEMAHWQVRAAGLKVHLELDIRLLSDITRGGSALTDPAIEVPDLASLSPDALRQPPTYVPNRNMILLSLAAAYAESQGMSHVFFGAQQQDAYGYWDCTAAFVEGLNAVLAQNHGVPVRIMAPFVHRSKREIVAIGRSLGVDYAHTWSCYRGGETPCGTCPTCVERERALGPE